MRFRTLALALSLALGGGAVSTVHAANKPAKQSKKYNKKQAKHQNKQRAKQSSAAKAKPHKAKKMKHA